MQAFNRYKKMYEFLNGKSLEDINKIIGEIEDRVNANCKAVKELADKLKVNVDVRDKQSIAVTMATEIGIFFEPSYKYELKTYTAKIVHLWDVISLCRRDDWYYTLKASEEKKDYIVLPRKCGLLDAEDIIKELQNGKVYAKKSPELLDLIEDVKKLDALLLSYRPNTDYCS